MEPNRIVVIGGGFAGLRTAVELDKRRARLKDRSITLIDPSPAHAYSPLLYKVATSELEAPTDARGEGLRRGATVSFETCSKPHKRERFSFRRGTVAEIDHADRSVILSDGERIPFDDLVVAIGGEGTTYGIPGVKEHAVPMRTIDDAVRLRARLHDLFVSYRSPDPFRVVVVGGGPAGVEFAAETARRLRLACDITVLEAGDDVLSMCSPGIRRFARQRLVDLGVNVRAQTAVKEVRIHSVLISERTGAVSEMRADLVMWAAGSKPNSASKNWGMPVDERGYITIDRSFAVAGMKNVYALGDCAAFIQPKTNARVPALAQAASREAGLVAENIARHLERKALTLWNPPEKWFTIVPLGGPYAVIDLLRARLRGRLAYFVLKIVYLTYFLSILPPGLAWSQWRAGRTAYRK